MKVNKNIQDLINETAKIRGFDYVNKKVIEEGAELTQAICHLDRMDDPKGRKLDYIVELGDSFIVVSQAISLLNPDELNELKKSIDFKLRREVKRIELEKTE